MSARDGAGPALVVCGMVGGLLAGARAGPGSARAALAVGVVALVGAWLTEGPARVGVAMLALALLGGAQMQRALDGLVHTPFAAAARAGETRTLRGTLVSDARGARFGADALVRARDGPGRRILSVHMSGADAGRLRVLEAGDRVVLTGRLDPLARTGPDARLRWKHVVARLDDAQLVAYQPAHGGLLGVANSLRAIVVRGAATLPPASRAVLAGFLLGDTRGIPDDVTDAYRSSGLSHLLAVSGANVAFVLALAGPFLRRLTLGPRTALALAIVLVFAAMTRFEPSVLRACALATIALSSSLLGRPASPLRALALAVVALLLIDPFLCFSLGFLLSVGASAGIVCFARRIRRRLPGPAPVADALAVSLAAQIGVAPVLLCAFGSVPLVTPLTNLLAVPVAEAIGVYGLLASIAAGLVPALGPVVQPPTGLLLAWVTAVARTGAAVGIECTRRGALGAIAVVAFAVAGRRFAHAARRARKDDRVRAGR